MGCNEGSATIEFPVKMMDAEIQKWLDEYGVIFKEEDPREQDHEMEVHGGGDLEAEIYSGIFRLHDSSACYGYFEELEDLLVKKAVPFDRHTSADWDIIPCDRIFRPNFNPFPNPGPVDSPHFNREFVLNPENDEPAVSLRDIRELLTIDDAGEEAAAAIRRYIDDKFPAYPPLSDYVEATHHES